MTKELEKYSPPKLVIFDLFGTLIKLGVRHRPYLKLLKWARENGRVPRPDDARYLMTKNLCLSEFAKSMEVNAPAALFKQIENQITEEIASLYLFDDVIPTFNKLNSQSIKIVICSNLARPYGKALELLPVQIPYLKCMSYEVGFIKPEPEIYQWILDTADVKPSNCLFVGDTFHADYEGPKSLGMRAYHLIRGGASNPHEIGSLLEI